MDGSNKVTNFRHVHKGNYCKKTRTYSGLPDEFYEPLLKQFGEPITTIEKAELPLYNNLVPHVLEQLKEHILSINGLDIEDIFRVSPAISAAEKAKELLNKNQSLSENKVDAQTAAYLIKCYFKELPEPFFNKRLYSEFVAALDKEELDLEERNFASLVGMVEEKGDYRSEKKYVHRKDMKEKTIKFQTLCWLADLGILVANNEQKNKMTLSSFSLVVTPNLIHLDMGMGFLSSNSMGNLDRFFLKFMRTRERECK